MSFVLPTEITKAFPHTLHLQFTLSDDIKGPNVYQPIKILALDNDRRQTLNSNAFGTKIILETDIISCFYSVWCMYRDIKGIISSFKLLTHLHEQPTVKRLRGKEPGFVTLWECCVPVTDSSGTWPSVW